MLHKRTLTSLFFPSAQACTTSPRGTHISGVRRRRVLIVLNPVPLNDGGILWRLQPLPAIYSTLVARLAYKPVQVVPVIPVIGKSDSMTVDEMHDFKREIVDLAAEASKLEFFTFSGG